jgi:hypothetical protein
MCLPVYLITYLLGAADAQYDVQGTGLPRPHADCLLEKVNISGGKFITAGATFAPGVKDVGPHLTRNGYIQQLRWIDTNYVVLWDEADKRGWLVNGSSALLHLVRASLKKYSDDPFSKAFLFNLKDMMNASEHKSDSAPGVLIDEKNRELEIHRDKTSRFDEENLGQQQKGLDKDKSFARKKKRGYYLFQDLVEQHYHILELIIDHNKLLAGQNGVRLKTRVRKHLEGWDFTELATDHDPYPRVATLHAMGYGWVDFVRSIGAITLFRRGFGDLIRPVESNGICSLWKTLPKNQYYLAANVSDLKNITNKFGDMWADPPKPVHDLLWHCPTDIGAQCPCQSRKGKATF